MIPVGPFQGRLARTPKFEHVGNNATPKWQATIAVDEPRWDSQSRTTVVGVVWVMVQAWGTLAEELWEAGYDQGDELAVTGRLAQYTVGEGDKKETKTHVTPLIVQCTRRKSPRPAGGAPAAATAPQGGSTNDPWASAPASSEPPF